MRNMSASWTTRWQPASARSRLGDRAERLRIARAPLVASPLLFAAPVALGIAVSFIRLLGIRYPDLGWSTTVNSDAEQLYLGHTLYQDPAHGYTGEIYTPFFPTVISLFDRLYLWNGWPLVIVIGSSVSLATLAGRIAYTRVGPAPRVACVLGAAGVGGIAYWCVSSIGLPVLDEGRADQLAWAFALWGLIAVADFGSAPSRRRVVTAVLLLSAALWTKQTTVAVVAPVVAWVVGLAAISALNRKAALLFVTVLFALNLTLLVALNLLTHGWEYYINFELAPRQSSEFAYGFNIERGLRNSALAAMFAGAMWLVSGMGAAARRRSGWVRAHALAGGLRERLAAEDPTGRRALLLVLYIVCGLPLAAYFMRKQGTDTNQLIGVVWALGLLAATGWRVAQRRVPTAVVAGGCVVVFFVLIHLQPVDSAATTTEISIPALETAMQWEAIPGEVIQWAGHHTLYNPLYSDLNVPQGGPLYPNYYNFADLLAGGVQPMYLVRALLDRRFDGVTPFSLENEGYASGSGKWEENYLWKLDEVIMARYVSMPGLPPTVLGRRPGPERAAWMRDCFGPFRAGGISFRIHHGGGFWCSFSPNDLQLVRAPVPLSEVVTTEPVRLAGTIAVGLEDRPGAKVDLVVEGGSAKWVARVAAVPRSPRDLSISTYLGGELLGSRRVIAAVAPGGRHEVRLSVMPTRGSPGSPISAGPGVAALTAPAAEASFALVATSGAEIDLHAMHLGH